MSSQSGWSAAFIPLKGVNWVASFVRRKCPSIRVITQQSHKLPRPEWPVRQCAPWMETVVPRTKDQGPRAVCLWLGKCRLWLRSFGINDVRLKNCVTDTPCHQVDMSVLRTLASELWTLDPNPGTLSTSPWQGLGRGRAFVFGIVCRHKGRKRS